MHSHQEKWSTCNCLPVIDWDKLLIPRHSQGLVFESEPTRAVAFQPRLGALYEPRNDFWNSRFLRRCEWERTCLSAENR